MAKPLIGIPCGFKQKSEFSRTPHYALTRRFMQAVVNAGGVPVMFGYEPEVMNDYITRCDGFILPDGRYRCREDFYDRTAKPEWATDTIRGPFDVGFAKKLLDADMPVLGICAGMQLLGCTMGAELFEDVQNQLPAAQDHLSPPAENPVHTANIVAGTKLHQILGATELAINTSHREAIKAAVPGVTISATCTDGVIEALELPTQKFAIGVQWHPEFYDCFPTNIAKQHQKLFAALIEAC